MKSNIRYLERRGGSLCLKNQTGCEKKKKKPGKVKKGRKKKKTFFRWVRKHLRLSTVASGGAGGGGEKNLTWGLGERKTVAGARGEFFVGKRGKQARDPLKKKKTKDDR